MLGNDFFFPPMEIFLVGLGYLGFFFLSYGTAAVCNFPMLQRNQKSEKISVTSYFLMFAEEEANSGRLL